MKYPLLHTVVLSLLLGAPLLHSQTTPAPAPSPQMSEWRQKRQEWKNLPPEERQKKQDEYFKDHPEAKAKYDEMKKRREEYDKLSPEEKQKKREEFFKEHPEAKQRMEEWQKLTPEQRKAKMEQMRKGTPAPITDASFE
ncbi:MAG: hypothetical protein V4507_03860 [Verrucomicrobiota bacterium]